MHFNNKQTANNFIMNRTEIILHRDEIQSAEHANSQKARRSGGVKTYETKIKCLCVLLQTHNYSTY